MNLLKDLFFLEQLDYLIRTKATGTPKKLASHLGVCERQIYRTIEQLRDLGFPIEYCKSSHSYHYSSPVELHFDIIINGEKLLSIKGYEK